MIADLKPYPEYKQSGLPWVGEIPTHWDTKRGKSLFIKMARPIRDGDDVVTCFRDGTVTLRKNRRLRGFTEAIFEFGYQGIRKGDLVIHAMDAFAGAIGVSDSDGKGTPVYAVCQPRAGVSSKYYASVVRQMAQSQWILALSRGIRERSTDFRFEMFGGQRLPLPPPSEQAAIVRFLDWANGRLERAIRAKRKVIELLHEQKQAIIHKAVIQGLDPNVPKRDSGIPWLGEIPAHWEVIRSRFLFRAVTRRDRLPSDPKLSVTQRSGLVRTDEMTENSTQAKNFDKFQICHPDDLVLNKYKAHLGVFCCAFTRGLITTNYSVFRPIRPLRTYFFDLLFHTKTYKAAFSQMVYGVTEGMSPLYTQDFYCIPVPVPPLPEQTKVIEAVAKLVAPQDSAIERYEREITLLREYRTRLVADVVTGKLDVREAALSLPEEDLPLASEDVEDEAEEPELEEVE